MTSPAAVETRLAAPALSRPPGWWGMLLLIATEASLFLVLIASYFYIRFKTTAGWPPGGIAAPKLSIPSLMTVLLVASSASMYVAELGIRRGNRARLELGLTASLLLGTLFLLLQATEWVAKLDSYTPETNAYASLFYTITGLHGAHVIVGLVLTGFTLVAAWRGAFSPRRHLTVQVIALYWQFIPAVWLVVFTSLYLTPRL